MTDLDPRIHPIRDDLAATHYRDKVKASRYVEGRRAQVTQTAVPLRIAANLGARRGSELLWGETVTVYDEKDGPAARIMARRIVMTISARWGLCGWLWEYDDQESLEWNLRQDAQDHPRAVSRCEQYAANNRVCCRAEKDA